MRAIAYPFHIAPGGSLASTTDYNQIVRGQVIDALMTNLGERVMRPNYGCDIQAALFDPTDELLRRDAASMIKERLQQFVPRCMVRSVKVELEITKPFIVVVTVVYRPNLYSTDQVLNVPVSSEFVNRSLLAGSAQETEVSA
jgi:phage baseplate assembly protein W